MESHLHGPMMLRGTRARQPFILMVMILLLGCVFIKRAPILEFWRDGLEHWEPLPDRDDAIFILLGDVVPRTTFAAVLFRDQLAPLIAMAAPLANGATALGLSPSEDAVACRILRVMAVPDSCIVVLPGPVESTYDEALAAAAWAKEHALHSLLFVTSSYHSSRARWILRKVLEPHGIAVHVAAVPTPSIDVRSWWTTEGGLVTVFNESVKSLFYRLKYSGRPS